MAKVTSKLQVTLPKAIADAFGIRPGDQIEWVAADDVIRVLPARRDPEIQVSERLALFDRATERQKRRQRGLLKPAAGSGRGWRREDLYIRGRAR